MKHFVDHFANIHHVGSLIKDVAMDCPIPQSEIPEVTVKMKVKEFQS